MKTKNTKLKVAVLLLCAFALLSFTQCCSTKKLQAKAPMTFGEVYYKSWVAGIEGGGSGTNLFIETITNEIILDSVYFRGEVSKLHTKPNTPLLYIGRFLSDSNKRETYQITEGSNPINANEKMRSDFPFDLKDNECVVSYQTTKERTKYYKLTGIIQKPSEAYPSARKPDNSQ